MSMICNVIVTKEDDTYIAKDLQTSVADQGDTLEEALMSLRDALTLYYEDNTPVETEHVFYTTLEVNV